MAHVSCTRRLHLSAGHRVFGHENKCRFLHGHNYYVFVTATAEELDRVGRVVDFGTLKDKVGGWLDEHWDHGFLVWEEDHVARNALAQVPEQKTYVLPVNPTAENMARYLLEHVCPPLFAGSGVTVVKIKVVETDNCHADAEVDPRA